MILYMRLGGYLSDPNLQLGGHKSKLGKSVDARGEVFVSKCYQGVL